MAVTVYNGFMVNPIVETSAHGSSGGKMTLIRMREVFVPGGLPDHTYVAREEFRLEDRLRTATDNLCKLVTITGPTKSGKSVLTQRVFPRHDAVWLDGGAIGNEEQIWSSIVSQLGGFTRLGSESREATRASITAEARAQMKLPFIAQASGGVSPTFGTERTSGTSQGRDDAPKNVAISLLRDSRKPLVIDDFHYLSREQQGNVIRALKALIFAGSPVIVIAIPHRRYDAIRVEKEMTGRVEQIEIPVWKPDELETIPSLGFELLNILMPTEAIHRFADESLGSPHLMQDFCRNFCERESIEETFTTTFTVADNVDLKSLFMQVAQTTSKIVFDRLARGPRQRKDRLQRRFVDGTNGDIYAAVLRAIALAEPGMTSIDYEVIRAKLRELLADEPPNMQQVSRVIEKMAEISATDEASTPVLDWDREQRRLHITDPFFAFFLKWGLPH